MTKTQLMPQGVSITKWLDEHLHEIQEAQKFTITDLPDEPAGLAQHLSLAQTEYARIGFLLADLEGYVLKAHASATLAVRSEFPDMTADERRAMAKADPDYLDALRLRDNVVVIVNALKSRAFALMNTRNNICNPAMSSGQ